MSHLKSKSAKRTIAAPIIRDVLAGRYSRLRILRTAMRHTEAQLSKMFRARHYFPPIVLGDKGEVLAGFAQAQQSNRSIFGAYVPTVKYSELTTRYIRGYISWVKNAARRGKWDRQMLAIELQYLIKDSNAICS